LIHPMHSWNNYFVKLKATIHNIRIDTQWLLTHPMAYDNNGLFFQFYMIDNDPELPDATASAGITTLSLGELINETRSDVT